MLSNLIQDDAEEKSQYMSQFESNTLKFWRYTVNVIYFWQNWNDVNCQPKVIILVVNQIE